MFGEVFTQENNRTEYSDENEDTSNNKDCLKLNNLWREMKDEKQKLNLTSTSTAIQNLRQKSIDQTDRSQQYDIESAQQTLLMKLQQTEHQLKKKNDQSQMVIFQLKETQEENEILKQQIGELVSYNQKQEDQLIEMASKLQLFAGNKDIMEKGRQNNSLIEKEIENKELQILELKEHVQQYEKNLQQLLNENNNFNEEKERFFDQIEMQNNENAKLSKKIIRLEQTLEEDYLSKGHGDSLLEIEYLKNDIERLLTLLKQTKEFKEFSQFSEDNKEIRYLKTVHNNIKAQQQKIPKKHCLLNQQKENDIRENLLWVPTDAFRFTHELSLKYNRQFNNQSIEELLFGLNQMWTNRETLQINKMNKKHEIDIQNLKSQLNKHLSYDEIQNKKTISRLKQQLSKQKGTQSSPEKRKDTQQSYQLKIQQDYFNDLQTRDEQIGLLKNKLMFAESEKKNYDKQIFMEGAIWMSNKTINELKKYRNNVNNLEQEFQEDLNVKLNIEQLDPRNVIKLFRLLMGSVDNYMENLMQKIKDMKVDKSINQTSNIDYSQKLSTEND